MARCRWIWNYNVMDEDKKIDWDNISNDSIKHNLVQLNYDHQAIRDKIIKLSERLEDVEKEYIMGNNILNNRLKGIHE